MTENECFGLVFAETGSINSGTELVTESLIINQADIRVFLWLFIYEYILSTRDTVAQGVSGYSDIKVFIMYIDKIGHARDVRWEFHSVDQ